MPRLPILLAASALAGCVSFNPYVRVSKVLLDDGNGTVNCWMRTRDECTKGCQNERAQASIDACLAQWHDRYTWLTSDTDAKLVLIDCLESKGWRREWISGTMHID